MTIFFFILIGVVLVGGSTLILLRTAKKPKVPDSVKPKPYSEDDNDDDSGW